MQAGHSTNPHHDAVLVHTILSFVVSNLASSDQRAARAFGVRPEQAIRMMDLTAAEMMRIASKGAHCLRVEIDPEAFEGVLTAVDQESNDTLLKHECIQHEASREMMTELFGVTNRDYAHLRQMLGMGRGNGRPKECRPEDAQLIYDCWQQQGCGRDAASLLSVAKELDMPLRVIWDELAEYGLTTESQTQRIA